ncbi:hypothetical protein [Hymenobacter sp. DG01]|uniref:hypothetical protein n=1 Tax=Hymenobacter sp. DG01 TaxID=2584940 RepID=UPI00215135DA|nr:hypothetical protein [Hymenobacter sp. DG01]
MAFHPLEEESFTTLQGFFLPHQAPPTPDSLPIADALIIDLVRQAVFGPQGSVLA